MEHMFASFGELNEVNICKVGLCFLVDSGLFMGATRILKVAACDSQM